MAQSGGCSDTSQFKSSKQQQCLTHATHLIFSKKVSQYLRDRETDLDGLWFLSRERDLSLLLSLESELHKPDHPIKQTCQHYLHYPVNRSEGVHKLGLMAPFNVPASTARRAPSARWPVQGKCKVSWTSTNSSAAELNAITSIRSPPLQTGFCLHSNSKAGFFFQQPEIELTRTGARV